MRERKQRVDGHVEAVITKEARQCGAELMWAAVQKSAIDALTNVGPETVAANELWVKGAGSKGAQASYGCSGL